MHKSYDTVIERLCSFSKVKTYLETLIAEKGSYDKNIQ